MKKTISLILLVNLILISFVYSQEDEALYTRLWEDGQTVKIFDHNVTRVFGEDFNRTSIENLFIPITNVGYLTQEQLLAEVNADAEKYNWNDKKKTKEINKYKQTAQGGAIVLYVQRKSDDAANTRWYTITVRDMNEKELFKQTLNYQVPDMLDFRQWSNTGYVYINSVIEMPFYVYVSQLQMENIDDFKFEISDN